MKLKTCFAIVLLLLLLCSCGSFQSNGEASGVSAPQKIVCTAPSNTEILVGLGMAESIIAADNYSADIEGLNLEKTKLMDFFTINAEEVLALEPDLVVASDINGIGTGDDPYVLLSNAGIEVAYLNTPETVDEIYAQIEQLGEITNKQKQASDMIAKMKNELSKIEGRLKSVTRKKNVYFEISPAPEIYTFGGDTFFNEILTRAGGTNIFAEESGWFSPSEEAVILANPDVIITNVTYIENAVDEIKARGGWWSVNAIIGDEVYSVNPNYTSRPSQNVVKAVEEISAALYPELFK